MNFPRREEATNKELILTIIEIQGYLARYGKSHTNWHETLNEVIERLEWIPVSERMPEDGQSVLFCDIDDDIMVGYHVKGRSDTHFSQDGTYEDMKNVRAWMPLPEPYKTESEG